jgi:hypothetical protein
MRNNSAIIGGSGRKYAEGSPSDGGGGMTLACFFLHPAVTNNTASMQHVMEWRNIIRRSGFSVPPLYQRWLAISVP